MHAALVIAIEFFAEDELVRPHAADDARKLSAALAEAGYAALDQVVLIDRQATKTTIESKFRRLLRSLTEEDTLLVYIASHGFDLRGKDFLAAFDTQPDDLEGTGVAWSGLLAQLRDCACQRVILLLDVDGRGLNGDGEPGFAEVREFFSASAHRVCLTSCAQGEASWPSPRLGHGAWASQILGALQGNAQPALVDGSLLTARSLQKFVEGSLRRELQKSYSPAKVQTPQLFGPSQGEVLIADLAGVVAKRRGGLSPEDAQRVVLAHEQVDSIRSLPGFKKEQKPPTAINSFAKALLAELTAEQIERDVNEVRDALKKQFAFKRKDLDAASGGDGTGSVRTPYFHYSITVRLNPADPGEVIWRRQVAEIVEPEQILTPAFENVFPKTFATLEFTPAAPIDVTSLIDELEEVDDERLKLTYDPAGDWCRVNMQGLLGQVEITPTRFALLHLHPQPPRKLIETFLQVQRLLTAELKVKGIGFGT